MNDDDDVTPAQVIRETWRWLPAALTVTLAIMLIGGIVTLVGWKASWWFTEQNVTKTNTTYQNSYGTQQADISSMETAIQAIAGAVDPAQATGDAQEACKYGALITNLPAGDAPWYAKNCDGPAVSPSSSYYSTSN
jgi:hypothetical protein